MDTKPENAENTMNNMIEAAASLYHEIIYKGYIFSCIERDVTCDESSSFMLKERDE